MTEDDPESRLLTSGCSHTHTHTHSYTYALTHTHTDKHAGGRCVVFVVVAVVVAVGVVVVAPAAVVVLIAHSSAASSSMRSMHKLHNTDTHDVFVAPRAFNYCKQCLVCWVRCDLDLASMPASIRYVYI